MGDEFSSVSNDGRIATEKSDHIFLINEPPQVLRGCGEQNLVPRTA